MAKFDELLFLVSLEKAFNDLGHNDLNAPKIQRNTEKAAYEFHIAKLLSKYASKRLEEATKQAITAGVIFDHKKEPRQKVSTETLYEGDYITVFLNMKSGRTIIDTAKFERNLLLNGVSTTVINKSKEDAVKQTNHSHEFVASFNT